MANRENQAAYKKRMYEAGYRQVQVWVPKESEGKTVKLERRRFVKKIELLTIGWSKTKLHRLFNDVIKYITEKIVQEDI